MNITYQEKLRKNFFYWGLISQDELVPLLGRIIDFQKENYLIGNSPISPLERTMVFDMVYVGLANSNDRAEWVHPDYGKASADFVERLAVLYQNRKSHPFFKQGEVAVSQYLEFLLRMTAPAHDLIDRYAIGSTRHVTMGHNQAINRESRGERWI